MTYSFDASGLTTSHRLSAGRNGCDDYAGHAGYAGANGSTARRDRTTARAKRNWNRLTRKSGFRKCVGRSLRNSRMLILPLTGRRNLGRFALVDAADFAWLTLHRWRYKQRHESAYALSKIGELHRAILAHRGLDVAGQYARFANGWGLDCRAANLLIGGRGDNARTGARVNVHRVPKPTWTFNGQTYLTFHAARAAARSRGADAREVKDGAVIDGYVAYVARDFIGRYASREQAEVARTEAARRAGYTTRQPIDALLADLDSLVSRGLLLSVDSQSERIEDCYRLPI